MFPERWLGLIVWYDGKRKLKIGEVLILLWEIFLQGEKFSVDQGSMRRFCMAKRASSALFLRLSFFSNRER